MCNDIHIFLSFLLQYCVTDIIITHLPMLLTSRLCYQYPFIYTTHLNTMVPISACLYLYLNTLLPIPVCLYSLFQHCITNTRLSILHTQYSVRNTRLSMLHTQLTVLPIPVFSILLALILCYQYQFVYTTHLNTS